MRGFFLVVILGLLCSLYGCGLLSKDKATTESAVDVQLSKSAPPPSPPTAAEEPRQGFAQEPAGTQNS